MYQDDDSPSGVFRFFTRYGLAVLGVVIVLSAAAWMWHVVTAPARMAGDVVTKVFDANHALETYRWFHSAYQQIQARKGQVALAKAALEAAAEDRKEARRVELLGLQQGCQSLVAEYNARATRADTVIFQHPERFLPGNWPGDRSPLPQSIDLSVCN